MSLIKAGGQEAYLRALKEEYFAPDPAKAAVVDTNLFATAPAQGAAVFTL